MLILSHADVDALVASIPPDELTQLMADVFRCFSGDSGIQMPPRSSVQTNTHTTLFMPSRVDAHGTAVKVVSVPTRGGSNGLAATTLVMDEASGGVKAVVNSRNLTAVRTAAGSLLATGLALGPNASPRHLVVFGAGAQAAAHITLLLRHYPSLTQCTIYNRSLNTRVERLFESLRRGFTSVTFICRQTPNDPHGNGDDVNFLHSDVNNSDIICTATSSSKALFPSSFVRPGTHLNLVGSFTPHMMEVETSLIRRAGLLMVDSRSACLLEAGELIAAGVRPEDMREVGELVGTNPKCPHLTNLSSDKVTVFKSVGLGVQDVVIAKLVVDLAERRGVGCKLNSYYDRDMAFG